ncbi:MAG: ClbS/DfsB family four-helix bundle protein [Chloroflexi bacterium]|nr:ClbS/DfsB family four-helix bundle protein [Chloroflexota bacterium]
MTTPANRDELLQRIREEREALERAVARVPAEKMTEPLLEGGWSVKDVLAHIAAWEGLMVGWVEESLRGGTPDRPVTGDDWVDRLNAQLYEQYRDMPLAEVQALSASAYERAYAIASRLTEAQLFDPDYFAWREGRPIFELIGGNTFWHYPEHREMIERMLAA